MPSLTKVQTGFLEPQGPFTLDAGTPTAPGLFFSGSSFTGLYRPGANQLGITINQTPRLVFDSSGTALFGGITTARTNFVGNLGVVPSYQFGGPGNSRILSLTSNDAAGGSGSIIFLSHEKSGTIGGNTALSIDDQIGGFTFQGSDGTNLLRSAAISVFIDGAVSSGIVPGRIIFSTTSSDGVTNERLRITSTGNVGIGTATPGAGLDIFTSSSIPLLRVASSTTPGYGYVQLGRSSTANHNWHFGTEPNGYMHFWNGNFLSGSGPVFSLYSPGNATNHAVIISGSGIAPTLTGTASQPFQVNGGAYVSGNVGIGTTNPSSELQVVGTITATTFAISALGTAAAPSIAFTGDLNTGIFSPGADQVAVSTGGVGRLFVGSTGAIGLSEASPTARLHLSGTSTAGGIKIVDSSASQPAPGIEVIGKRSDGNTSSCFAGKLLLSKNTTSAAINSTNVLGSVAFGGNHTDGTEANILYSASIVGAADGAFNSATDMPTALVFNTGATGRAPDTANVTTGTERLRITSAGNVGIGATNPSGRLVVVQANGDFYNPIIRAQRSSTETINYWEASIVEITNTDATQGNISSLAFAQGVNHRAGIWSINRTPGPGIPEGDLVFGTCPGNGFGAATEKVRVKHNGNVGIGTTNPTGILDLVGNTLRLRNSRTPASSTAAGSVGEICWDANYVYVCTSTNTWRRSALSSW